MGPRFLRVLGRVGVGMVGVVIAVVLLGFLAATGTALVHSRTPSQAFWSGLVFVGVCAFGVHLLHRH